MLEAMHSWDEEDTISDLPLLPASVHSMDGQEIDISSPVWEIRASADGGRVYSINWQLLDSPKRRAVFTKRAWYLVKLYLVDRLTKRKAGTVCGSFEAFFAFERWLADTRFSPANHHSSFHWSDYTEGIARGFLAHSLDHTAGKGKRFSQLRDFYRWGIAHQYPDFSPTTSAILESIKAPGNLQGHHVRFRDPLHGPFSPDEVRLITGAIESGAGRVRDRILILLHLELGLNQNATTRLKNKDLKRYEQESTVLYQLDVPRVKKRTVQRETKRRPISNRLGTLLESQKKGEPEDPLLHWLSTRNAEKMIREAMQRFAEAAALVSPHTHERLKIHPRRFRYTLATNMAEEGASKFHLAEVLDHTDTAHVNVYVETVSSIADPVAKATDVALRPLVRRFLGIIVDSANETAFEGIPNQLIPGAAPHLPGELLNVGGIGLCGRDVRKFGLCKLFPPLSCYLCPSFAALRTGPHQEMLDALQAYIQWGKDSLDKRILMQLNDLLSAIREVLAQLDPGASAFGE